MQPSSLIFVLVVAIWAVYLLQYWIKRRDHLSTVRSVDRFSAAMRVLDDHRLRREATEPTPRSYAVTPARTARPEVTVKHAGAPARARMVEPVVGAPRRVRGLVLLTMLVLLPVVTLVAAFGPLTWWVALAWLVGTVAAFGWLRQAVQAEREARGRARAQERRTATATAPTPRRAEPAAREASPAPRRSPGGPRRRGRLRPGAGAAGAGAAGPRETGRPGSVPPPRNGCTPRGTA